MAEESPQQSPPLSATGMYRARPSSLQSGGSSGDREKFERDELAIVLSHFDLGILQKLKDFPKGSRKAPKLLIKSNQGAYLLKRRAVDKCDPKMVAFCHGLQMHLAAKQFPLPHLVGTREDNNSMLEWSDCIYEVFEFINGTRYDRSLEATQDAGRILGLFHQLITDYQSDYKPPSGTYHGARAVEKALDAIPDRLAKVDPEHEARKDRLGELVAFLRESYQGAWEKAESYGLAKWPKQVCHSDWHPGNMLYLKTRIVAVIDYDAARYQQRIIDAANGALQFSVIRTADTVDQWPEHLDLSRFKRFLMGYDGVNQLSQNELEVIPWLMMEAMIAEASIPVATAGRFAHIDGFDFLEMVERKVRWLKQNAAELTSVLDD
ncbi:MAG: phosphotransferase [Phycisphaeraceae bacterium]|nr:phosphotransferase [Phycisphaeraceae bacterium]